MKAKDIAVGTPIESGVNREHLFGKIINNDHPDGDEVVEVEWEEGDREAVNVNDLFILENSDRVLLLEKKNLN